MNTKVNTTAMDGWEAAAQEMRRSAKKDPPWNWCYKCKQLVDVDDVSDGSIVRCIGCKRHFVATYFTNGKWALVPDRRLDCSRKPPRKTARKEAK